MNTWVLLRLGIFRIDRTIFSFVELFSLACNIASTFRIVSCLLSFHFGFMLMLHLLVLELGFISLNLIQIFIIIKDFSIIKLTIISIVISSSFRSTYFNLSIKFLRWLNQIILIWVLGILRLLNFDVVRIFSFASLIHKSGSLVSTTCRTVGKIIGSSTIGVLLDDLLHGFNLHILVVYHVVLMFNDFICTS